MVILRVTDPGVFLFTELFSAQKKCRKNIRGLCDECLHCSCFFLLGGHSSGQIIATSHNLGPQKVAEEGKPPSFREIHVGEILLLLFGQIVCLLRHHEFF